MKTRYVIFTMLLLGATLPAQAADKEEKPAPEAQLSVGQTPAMSEIPTMKQQGERMAVLMQHGRTQVRVIGGDAFTLLPKLGVVGNSAIMNVEPVFALVLAWVLLNQAIAPIQVAGALVVVSTVMYLGLRKR